MTFKYCFLFVYTGYLIIIDCVWIFFYIRFNVFITRVLSFARKKVSDISERKRGDWKKETRCYSLWMLDDGVSRLTWRSRKRGCRSRRGDSPSFLSDEASWREYIPPTTTRYPLSIPFAFVVATILPFATANHRRETKRGKVKRNLLFVADSLLNYRIKTIRYSSILNIFTKE